MTLPVLRTAALLALAPLVQGGDDLAGPPGMVLVKGERVKVGLAVDEAEKKIRANEQLARAYAAETPQHEVLVEDFYMGLTEVTNEQYAEFVRATGSKPPQSWGRAALDAAALEFAAEQAKLRQEARERGEQRPREVFDAERWWNQNWSEIEWKLPADSEAHPVTWVDFQAASAYARWVGMRLPTEYEYQAAVRGGTSNVFPWGDDWKDKEYAHTMEAQVDRTMPVGSFPKGVSADGLHDLAGGVWEWTQSPFVGFEGNKPLTISMPGGRKVQAYGDFDPDQRVTVGGSFRNAADAARASVRLGTARYQATELIGFRLAATPRPGRDMADAILREELRPMDRPEGVDYAPGRAMAMDRWESRDGSSELEGYTVVTGYRTLHFLPVAKVGTASLKKLQDMSLEAGPVHLGALYTTEPLVQPELEPGLYLVAFRAAGKARSPSAASASASTEEGGETETETETETEAVDEGAAAGATEGLDTRHDQLLFLRVGGELAGSLQASRIEYGRLPEPSLSVERIRAPEETRGLEVVVPMDVARFRVPIESTSRTNGFVVEVPFAVAPGTLDGGWRQ